ncbi:hypothetical protein IFM89_032025 [Coptis chinensis]|uniref:Uncharacterized protein n=1 Tax=Coptis chinensis TaxID=261450 RepID=A0A835H263_9MAGN|nr:hypothetical protein IFM89_032025 [Coptis chinensis]
MSSTPPLESDPTVDSSSSVLVPTPTVDSSIVVVENEEEEDLKYGFKRDEMYKDKFPIKSDEYDRHVFLSYKTASSWPPRVEDQSYDPLPSLFADSFKSNKSQIGKYAGNVIVFGAGSDGKVKGHWYGYVTPDDVPLLLDQHIGKGEVVEHLWRGEVCHPYEEKAEETEQKPKESDGVSLPNGTHFEKTEGETQGSSPKGMRQNGGGCCQGANGGTCCQDDSVELENKVAGKKPREGNGVCTRGVDKVSSWMGKLDQADAYTAVGVIGAVATVAVAYSIYRRSG